MTIKCDLRPANKRMIQVYWDAVYNDNWCMFWSWQRDTPIHPLRMPE
jgi:hypothetical protein